MKVAVRSNHDRQSKANINRRPARQQGKRRASSKQSQAFNSLIPREQIKAYCDAVAREFRPRQIILFGSYAYGQPNPDSDVDLLVVLPFRGSDVRKAIQIRSRFDTPFPMDLIVRKP